MSGSARSISVASSPGRKCSSPRIMATARNNPAAPPASDSTRLSISSCRTSCQREAPTASRTATSFCRDTARAISRLATLKQAISSTSPTMHISTISAVE